MLTRRERGADAAWLREARKSRWSNAHAAVDAFRDATGHTIHYSRWAAYESGSKPIRDEDMDALVAYFGSEPGDTAPSTDTDLASAIREQARAIERLAKALERERDEAPAWAQAVVDAVLAGRRLLSTDVERDEREGSDAPRRGRAT